MTTIKVTDKSKVINKLNIKKQTKFRKPNMENEENALNFPSQQTLKYKSKRVWTSYGITMVLIPFLSQKEGC